MNPIAPMPEFNTSTSQWVWINGAMVPSENAVVSVFDRSFLYGDGLFEGILVYKRVPFLWSDHLQRLERGAKFLGIEMPYSAHQLRQASLELASRETWTLAFLRIHLSRGVGRRGYSPVGAKRPSLIISLHPIATDLFTQPGSWKLITSSVCIPCTDPLSQHKTANKLPQILAKMEADNAGANEALIRNSQGHITEGSSSNLFWIRDGEVHTPPLATGALAGVTRQHVLSLCTRLQLRASETNITPSELFECEGVFLSLSSWGIVSASHLEGRPLRQSPIVETLRAAYWQDVETASD
jgi:branched-chain amino acid aminotransferase